MWTFELIRTNNFIMKTSFSILLFLIISVGTFAQSDITQSATRAGQERYQDIPYFKRQKLVNKQVTELKEGSLIVRLMVHDTKIKYLREKGRDKEANELDSLINTHNQTLIEEFQKDYDFSEVYFAYGKDIKRFINKEDRNIFVNSELQIDPKINLKEGPVFILAAQGTDNYYLYDENMQRIPEPAPHAINFFDESNTNLSVDRFIEILAGSSAYILDVYYFNDKLFKIYRKATKGRKRSRTR